MLTGSGFRDDAGFSESLGKEDLAEGVVDLVGSGVKQILALQVDFRAAELFGPAFGEIERGRTADVVVQQVVELGLEGRVASGLVIGDRQLLKRSHEGFRDEHAAEFAEVAGGVWKLGKSHGQTRGQEWKEASGRNRSLKSKALNPKRRGRAQARPGDLSISSVLDFVLKI